MLCWALSPGAARKWSFPSTFARIPCLLMPAAEANSTRWSVAQLITSDFPDSNCFSAKCRGMVMTGRRLQNLGPGRHVKEGVAAGQLYGLQKLRRLDRGLGYFPRERRRRRSARSRDCGLTRRAATSRSLPRSARRPRRCPRGWRSAAGRRAPDASVS